MHADALATASEQLTKVVDEMKLGGLDKALFPWTNTQEDALLHVTRLCRSCAEVLPEQIISKRTGIPSPIEREKARSQRQIDAKREKQPAKTEQTKRGRPRKAKA